jgi:hypothetical protein
MKRKLSLALCVTAALMTSLLPGCKKNDHSTNDFTKIISPEMQLEYKTAFAKTLAKAVTNKDFRNFLKGEALKKFDWDNDVFYPMIKDEKLPSGESIHDYLSNIIKADKKGVALVEIEQGLPLLNILVPSFENFSAEQWNTGNQVPLVAIRNKADANAGKPLLAYDSEGKPTELDYYKEPSFPIIIIKDNEALEMKGGLGGKQMTPLHKLDQQYQPVCESNGIAYYFADENLYTSLTIKSKDATPSEATTQTNGTMGILGTGCERAINWENFDVLTQQAFTKNIYNPICPDNVATTRDYIYYGIDPTTGIDQGPLKYNYRECITSIRCLNLASRGRIDDVGEGNILEFNITVYTVDNDPVFPLKKTISIPKDKFFVTDAYNPNPKPIDLTNNNIGSIPGIPPVQLAVWNFKRQGDIWKYAIYEYDPSVTVSETRSISATIGTNFTAGSEEKKGGKFGISATVTATASTTISYTDGSDDCGEAISYWCDPVIIQKFDVVGSWDYCGSPVTGVRRPPRVPTPIGRSYEINTGTIALTVEPRAL